MSRPRIGLVGYFGYGNYGDELFLDVYRQFFGDCDLVVIQDSLDHPIYSPNAYEAIGKLDVIIIGGGDLLIAKYFPAPYFDEHFLTKPIYFHSVGVPLWMGADPAVVGKLRAFVQHPNVRKINVRDIESAAWVLENLKPSVPVDHSCDMVFALDLPQMSIGAKKKIFGLIMRKLNPNETKWINVASLCDRARDLGYEIHNIILGTGRIRDHDLAGLLEFHYPNMVTIDPNDIHQLTVAIGACDAVASTKFHGCVVALAYGIPAITLSTTDKFNNLYRKIERQDLNAHFIHQDLRERLPKYLAPIPGVTRKCLRSEATEAMLALRRQILTEFV